MKNTSLLCIAVSLILTSCTASPTPTTNTGANPYPTISSGSSGALTPTTQGSNFKATGTEPFWSMELSDTEATVSQPNESGSTTEDRFAIQQTVSGDTITVKDAKGEFLAKLEKKACEDGMSDKKYDYIASVNYREFALKGCANKK